MKAMHSADYYEAHWDRFMTPVHDWHEHYMNFECELEAAMECFNAIDGIPAETLKNIETTYAEQIVSKYTEKLKEDMKTISDVESGKASFGFTTQSQEIRFRHDFRMRWEFNCYQLSKFKKAHLS